MTAWALDDPQRLALLAELDVFPGIPDDSFDVFTRLVSRMLDTPVALVSFVADDRQFFPSSLGLIDPWSTRGQTPLSMSFCQHVVTGDKMLLVSDASSDERVAGNEAIPVLGVQAYLGVPLRGPEGEPLGSLCAIDGKPRKWSDADVAILHDIAEAVASTIALRVSEHRRARYAREASHELRTPLAALQLELEDLLATTRDAPDAQDGVRSSLRQVSALGEVVHNLVAAARSEGPLHEADVDMMEVLRVVLRQRQLTGAIGPDAVSLEGDAVQMVHAAAAVLRHVIGSLIDAVTTDGQQVRVRVTREAGMCRVQMLAACRHALGSPLDEVFLKQLGGRLSICPIDGVAFELALPV